MSILDKAASLFGYASPEPVVVHDAEGILADLRQARLDAPEGEHPGLDHALLLVEEYATRSDRERIAAWVRGHVVGVDAEPLDRVHTDLPHRVSPSTGFTR